MGKNQNKVTAKEKCAQRLLSLEKSLKSLETAYQLYRKEPNKNIPVMALIKNFELSFELSWKALKYFLEYKEIVKFKFARDIIKQAFHKSIIKEGQLWINMLEDRNKLSHIYDESLAAQTAGKISGEYIKEIKTLYQTLKKEL